MIFFGRTVAADPGTQPASLGGVAVADSARGRCGCREHDGEQADSSHSVRKITRSPSAYIVARTVDPSKRLEK